MRKVIWPRPWVSTRFRLDLARTLLDKGEVNCIENTLDYHTTEIIATVKIYMAQAPGFNKV